MSDTVPDSPLTDFLSRQPGSSPSDPGVRMSERPLLGYVNLRGDAGAGLFTEAVSRVLGVTLPTRPNTTSQDRQLTLCWLGPDEWMAIVAPGDEMATVRALQDAMGALHASVVDVTGGYTTVNLTGSRVRELLSKGCTLDLDPSLFAPGQCAQTNLAKAAVLLLPRDNQASFQSFDIVVRRSFADYLARWLEHSGGELGLEIVSMHEHFRNDSADS